jgi:hypothetical protein
MKYINEDYAHNLLGKRFPLGVKRVVKFLNQYLNKLDDDGYTLPGDLLFHNISKDRNRSISDFAKIDTDMVLEMDNISKRLNIDLRDYTKQPEFAREYDERRVVLHIVIKDANKTTWVIHLPLQSLMVGFGDPMDGYHCYGHGISFLDENGSPLEKDMFYCGITKRGWLTRMTEHFRDIKGGSNKTFHKRWREYQGESNVLLNSELIALNHSFDAAMNWEEWIVDKYISQDKSLNMIPGGFKGLKVLSRWQYFSGPEGRAFAVRGQDTFTYFKNESRTGIPNPMIEKLWRNDQYYAKVIGNRDSTFSSDDINKIRAMAQEGYDAESIGRHLGIQRINRVKNVLNGKTYRRM